MSPFAQKAYCINIGLSISDIEDIQNGKNISKWLNQKTEDCKFDSSILLRIYNDQPSKDQK